MELSPFGNLDPELRAFVEVLPDMTDSFDDIDGVRALIDSFLAEATMPIEGEDLLEITDEVADGVPVRVYRPREATGDLPGTLPGILYLHGGGFCIGSIATEHAAAVALANAVQAVVVSVEYRLAPEHPYPAGLEDCYAGLEFLAELPGVDPSRLAVHGQSAGGGLAAATALLARDNGGPRLCFQSLGIPELDDRLETASMQQFADTPMWSRPQAVKSWEYYLGGRPADGYAAPARMEDLSGLPPAYVVTCELDPLRDEGLAYASRLLQAGVSVELHNYPGAFHGSFIVPTAAVVRRMGDELVVALRRALHP